MDKTKPGRRIDLGAAFRGFIIEWSKPLSVALFAFVFYSIAAAYGGGIFSRSDNPYYNFLADALLNGQLNLRINPPSYSDLILYNGQLYLYWPPLPALLMIPFVAVFGVAFSDVFFATLISAVDSMLVAAILKEANQKNLIHVSPVQRGLLVVFFTLGTMFSPLAGSGNVWSLGQLTGLACVGLAYWAVLRFKGWKAFLLAGVGIGAAFAARNSLILLGAFPAWFLLHEHWNLRWKRLFQMVLLAMVPIAITLLLIGLYNYARFGNPFEIGYQYHMMDEYFRPLYEKYGPFNLHYLPTNLYYQFIFYPFPARWDSAMGGSVFLLSPLFFGALWSLWQDRRQASTWALLAAFIIGYIPIGLLMGTGYFQYGPRYLLDLVIPLMLLTARGIRRWPLWLVCTLILISLVHYIPWIFM